ncbi:MAG: hypothetical protein K2Y37_06590 [Pirellulales bacterium]|nr:hypothetical protein [Pirellulales bacterium]
MSRTCWRAGIVIVCGCLLSFPAQVSAYQRYYRGGGRHRYRYGYNGAMAAAAMSQANLLNAQAAGVWEQAWSQRIQNQLAYARMFYERRQVHDTYMQAHAKPRLTLDDVKRLNASRDPKPLAPNQVQLDGDIVWPQALQGARFAEERTVVQVFFAAKYQQGESVDADIARFAQQTLEHMKSELQSQIRELPSTEYLAARSFLDSLYFEGFQQRAA